MRDNVQSFSSVSPDVAAGAVGYTMQMLKAYDQLVLAVIARYLWRCPSREVQAQYDAHASANHLDVGVGTGYFLDHCRFPTANPKITLSDLNKNCLDYVAERIRRYSPTTVVANVLDPLPLPAASFDSIGLNYVLHCLPGPMVRKAEALKNLRVLLKEGGVLFGATLLGKGWTPSLPAQLMMWHANRVGGFSNRDDDLPGLETALRENFKSFSVRMVGGMALFVAKA